MWMVSINFHLCSKNESAKNEFWKTIPRSEKEETETSLNPSIWGAGKGSRMEEIGLSTQTRWSSNEKGSVDFRRIESQKELQSLVIRGQRPEGEKKGREKNHLEEIGQICFRD